MRSQVAALVGFCLVVGGVAGQGDMQLEGTWLLVSMEKGGKKKDLAGEGIYFIFGGGKLSLKKGDETKDGTYKVDTSKKPRQIDMTVEQKGINGVYEIKDGTLRMCVAEAGDPRPTAFKVAEDSKAMLISFSREKKEKK
jgi:uncharacterized protein (TIGR03067 family)